MSVALIARTIWSTASHSARVVMASRRGTLTLQSGDEVVRAWARDLLRIAEVTVETEGLERVGQSEPWVVMSNHQSLYDIPVLLGWMPLVLRMVAKAELFRVPLWSRAMLETGFVPIHRGVRSRAREDLKVAERAMQRGVSIWIAPEGTRSPDGQLLPFKRGGFHLAENVGARILPVTVTGTRDVLRIGSIAIARGKTVRLQVGNPIDPRDFSGRRARDELVEAVRDAIAAPLAH